MKRPTGDIKPSKSGKPPKYAEWKTYLMSDHLVLWTAFKVDFADDYLSGQVPFSRTLLPKYRPTSRSRHYDAASQAPYIFTGCETHIRSSAASFRLPTFGHSFMLAAEEVQSLSPAGCPASFPKKDGVLGMVQSGGLCPDALLR
jgi:hypothetical protein